MKPKKHIDYYPGTKKIYREFYKLNGKRHRENGPAMIWYYENGNIEIEEYYINDEYHREDGPAYIRYYKNGNISNERYCINDKYLTKQEFDKYIRKRDSKIFDKLLEEMANGTDINSI